MKKRTRVTLCFDVDHTTTRFRASDYDLQELAQKLFDDKSAKLVGMMNVQMSVQEIIEKIK